MANNGNNYFQNVKMLTKKERKKVDGIKKRGGGVAPQTPSLGKIPTQATPMTPVVIDQYQHSTASHGLTWRSRGNIYKMCPLDMENVMY